MRHLCDISTLHMTDIFVLLPTVALLALSLGWWLGLRHWPAGWVRSGHLSPLRDPITGLWNHVAMQEVLVRTLSLAERLRHPVTVLLVQIDDFAEVQQRLGRATSQTLEMLVGQRLQQRVRTHDVLGYWQAGQFLAVLPDTDVATALVLVHDIRQLIAQRALSTPLEHPSQAHHLTVSVGIHSRQPMAGQKLQALAKDMVARAHRALLETPQEGPNRIEIEP